MAPRHDRSLVLLDASGVALTLLKETTPVFSQIAALALFIVEAVQSTRANKEAYRYLVADVVQLTHQILRNFGVSEEKVVPSDSVVPDKFIQFIRVLEDIKDFSTRRVRRRFWTRLLQNASDADEIRVFRERLQHAMNMLGLQSHVSIHGMQETIESILKQQVMLMGMIKRMNTRELSAGGIGSSCANEIVVEPTQPSVDPPAETTRPSEANTANSVSSPSFQRNPFRPGFQSPFLPSPSSDEPSCGPSSLSSSSTLYNQNNPFNDYFSIPVHSSPVQTPATPPTCPPSPCCVHCRCDSHPCCSSKQGSPPHAFAAKATTPVYASQTTPPLHSGRSMNHVEGQQFSIPPIQPSFELRLPSHPFPHRRRSQRQGDRLASTTAPSVVSSSNLVRRSHSVRLEIKFTVSSDDQESETSEVATDEV